MRFTIALVTILLAGNAAYAKNYNSDKPYGKYTDTESVQAGMKKIVKEKDCVAVYKPKDIVKTWDRNK